MIKNEVALQLTLKALEEGHVSYRRTASLDGTEQARSEANAENARQISAFYCNILRGISQSAANPNTKPKKP